MEAHERIGRRRDVDKGRCHGEGVSSGGGSRCYDRGLSGRRWDPSWDGRGHSWQNGRRGVTGWQEGEGGRKHLPRRGKST